jgi:hypothetical protein
MDVVTRFRSLTAILAIAASGTFAAEDPKPQPAPTPDRYFSGTVVSHDADSLTVSRTVLGRNQVSRSFVLVPETVIEGELKERSRVTVEYVTREDVRQATHIIVRNPPPKK